MQNVTFDPGFASCMLGVSDNVEFMYSAFISSYGSLKQKKFQFSILFPKIKSMLKQNVAFYLGCLLWAAYLKNIEDGFIEDNPCINGEYNEEQSLSGVWYLIDFVSEKLNKDSRYYINKPFEADEKYIKILKAYEEFVKLNKGFVSIQNTKDILLPSSVKTPNAEGFEAIKEKIDETIKTKNLSVLYDVYKLILD